jgi:hypothetical protein
MGSAAERFGSRRQGGRYVVPSQLIIRDVLIRVSTAGEIGGGLEGNPRQSRIFFIASGGLMAHTCLKKIAAELLREGLTPETPAAFVERAGPPQESKRTMPLETLQDQQADSPATVIVGDVVGLLNPAAHFPLLNKDNP